MLIVLLLPRMECFCMIAELHAWREAPRVSRARDLSNTTHPRKFGNHVTVHRATERPSAPQGNKCFLSHFLASLGVVWEPKKKLIAHQCCDQLTAIKTGYPLTSITWPRAQVSTHRSRVLFEVIRWQITNFKWSQAQVYFSNDSYQICCVYVTMAPHY